MLRTRKVQNISFAAVLERYAKEHVIECDIFHYTVDVDSNQLAFRIAKNHLILFNISAYAYNVGK
jgi:hypothetical protein